MLPDEPCGLVILDGNCRRALKALVEIEEVEAGIATLVDPIAVRSPLCLG